MSDWKAGPYGRFLLLPLTVKGWITGRKYVVGAIGQPKPRYPDGQIFQYVRAANHLEKGDLVWCDDKIVGVAQGNVTWGYYTLIQRHS